MKRLPPEILSEIFLYLHPKNKVDCMLVCRRWKLVIEYFSFYNVLDICSRSTFNKVIAMIEENPDIGKRVEHLTVSLKCEKNGYSPHEILRLLPKLRAFIFTGKQWKDIVTEERITYSWNKHIEYINEYSSKSITCGLLLCNTCPNLTTISIYDPFGEIIPLLNNAPSLRNLTLRTTSMSFHDLDTVHENAPHLECFTGHLLTLKNSELSQILNPAMSVTECHFNEVWVRKLETRVNLLLYTSKKYPNLSKFTYNILPSRIDNGGITKLTDSDWFPLLQNVGLELKALSLCGHGWVDNAFKILDKFKCRIEHLRICRISCSALMKIIESRQCLYIQTLTVCDIDFETYDWLKELQALKKLKISFSPYRDCETDIELHAILDNSPPTLGSLSIHKAHLIADLKYAGVSHIDSLSFSDMNTPKGIDTFISQCFPKLSNLKLKRCIVEGGEMNLEKMDLLNFFYLACFINDSDSEKILIVTFDNNERRCYSIRNGTRNAYGLATGILYHSFYPPTKYWAQNNTDTELQFTLLCNTLNNCIVI